MEASAGVGEAVCGRISGSMGDASIMSSIVRLPCLIRDCIRLPGTSSSSVSSVQRLGIVVNDGNHLAV